MSLSPDQTFALRELHDLWPDRAMVIIGATALGFYLDMIWRKTADVDLLVALDLDEFPGKLVERIGWKRHPELEHRFFSPQGCQLDILPAGEESLSKGTIEWARGHIMSLAGIDLAFGHAAAHEVAGGQIVKVAPPSVVTVLKMAAYLDRPHERLRDLGDLAHLLELYVDENSPRFWDEAMACGEFELAPAYLLGLDIGSIAAEPHLELVRAFISRVGDPEGIDHAQMQRRGPRRWTTEDQPLHRRLQALVEGLQNTIS